MSRQNSHSNTHNILPLPVLPLPPLPSTERTCRRSQDFFFRLSGKKFLHMRLLNEVKSHIHSHDI